MRLSYGRVFYYALASVLAVACGGGGGTDAPVATSVTITPTPVNLASVGATQALAAVVRDQNNNPMTGQTVTWSSSNGAAASVGTATGVVTAVGNGTAQITATSGSATGNVTVTVAQVPAQIQKTGGDTQTGTVASALTTAITVRVRDALGAAISGQAVTFAAATGGGQVQNTTVNTNATGDASTTWTLGQSAGTQTATATAGALAPATFAATANAGAPTAISVNAGNNQNGTVNFEVAIDPAVRVADQFDNPVNNQSVTFTVTAGAGSTTPANGVVTTNTAGIATLTAWTLGPSAGTNTLQATITGTALSTSFTATAAEVGAPATIAVLVGNNQTAHIGHRTNIRPAVRVTDSNGAPVAGVAVTFAVSGGGGGATGTSVSTNSIGVAQVGSWTVGGVAGSNTMTATATPGGIANNPITFTATAQTGQYNIVVRNTGTAFSPSVQAAFDAAESTWESMIYGDQSDVALNLSNVCGTSQNVNETIDDILILAQFDNIDGPGGILAQAGSCVFRSSNGLPLVGVMFFDSADSTLLSQGGNLSRVILHEMAHVLGFSGSGGTQANNVFNGGGRTCGQNLVAPGGSIPGGDIHFNCANAVAMFDSIGGTSYTGGAKVPLENCVDTGGNPCGAGQINSHWREVIFDTELMTPYFNSTAPSNPLSLVTLAAFSDLGYLVSYHSAEAYTRVFSAPLALRAPAAQINLGDDVILPPGAIVDDRTGRVIRTWPGATQR